MKPDNGDMMAFPVQASDAQGSMYAEQGLTKREMFAAMAMQGNLANCDNPGRFAAIAVDSVIQADALLAALAHSAEGSQEP